MGVARGKGARQALGRRLPVPARAHTHINKQAHLAGGAVLVVADLVAAEAHAGALAAHHLVVADHSAAGAGVDPGRVLVHLAGAVVGLDDGVHGALLHVDALVALSIPKSSPRQQVAKESNRK